MPTPTDDLVARLRAGTGGGKHWMSLHEEAADAIERLQAENQALRADAERGRFIIENWNSTVSGVRLHHWISDNILRLGGVRAAIDAAKDRP